MADTCETETHARTPPTVVSVRSSHVVRLSKMDSKHKALVEKHRAQFVQSVDADRLLATLQQQSKPELLTAGDVSELAAAESGGPAAKVGKLLDLLAAKGPCAFEALCVALETTYPHLLTVMFLGASQDPQSLTSDSDDDGVSPPSSQTTEDDPGGGSSQGALRVYSHPQVHQYSHLHSPSHPPSHPPSHLPRPLSVHEADLFQNNMALLKAELKLVTTDRDGLRDDRDMLRDELRKMQTKIDTYKHANMATDVKHGGLGGSSGVCVSGLGSGAMDRVNYICSAGDMKLASEKHGLTHTSHDYERLKAKCEWAENELQSLKRKQGETVKKCDQAVKEADMFRNKYKLTKDKIDQSASELHSIKAQYNALLADKQRLDQEVLDLQKVREEDRLDIEELRKQQREVISESGSSEALNKLYDTALDKYKAVKQEYDNLRTRYADLRASHNVTVSKLELVQEENGRLRKQYEEVSQDLNTAIMERNGLQQQCTSAIMKWDNVLREKSKIEKELQKLRMERDEYKKGRAQAVADTIKASKDNGRLRGERDAVVHEYSLIMSERDSVHKEMEQLQDKLTETQKKLDTVEKEKKSISDEVETLRQEISSALHDRDHALKVVNELREKAGDDQSDKKDVNGLLGPERDHCRLNLLDQEDRHLRDSYEQIKMEVAENKELVSKETEALRREMERLQADLNDAVSEAELSKRRRDWAFSERDKIVLERESIKTLCDRLRQDRDRAVSEQAQALRDLDDLKKKKNEATKELTELKDKYEGLLEKEARKTQLHSVGHNNSRDSAIDADLQEWETETLELDIGAVSSNDIGFDLVGGKDDPQFPNDTSIFVSNVSKNSTAHGKLKVNDQLVRINNMDITNTEKRTVLQAVKNGGSVINMVVRRRKSSTTRPIQPVHLHLSGTRELGLSIESGLYISRILPGSAAAKEGNLAIGDRILNVNGHSVENLSVGEVLRLVEEGGDHVVLSVLKYAPTPQPSLVSSSASSGQILTESSPEAPSTSPRSPRSRLWVNTSPDSSKPMNIKSSGSQTDSLDSPPTVGRTCNGNVHHESERAYIKMIGNLFPSDRERERGKDREMEREKNSQSMSGHIMVMSGGSDRHTDDEAIGVIEEISEIIKQQQSKTPLAPRTNDKHSKREKERENGGTWPKCRTNYEYPTVNGPGGFKVIIPKKERPPLSNIAIDPQYMTSASPVASPSPQSSGSGDKVPPTPPVRKDSFNRGASIKHSPQNSDSSVKYNHMNNMVPTGMTSKSSSYLTSSPSMQPAAHPMMGSVPHGAVPMELQSKSNITGLGERERDRERDRDTERDSRDRESRERDSHKPQNMINSDKHSMYFAHGSSPDSGPLDNTVVSAKLDPQDQLHYMRHSRSSRPTSAPSRGRKERWELANMVHGAGPHQPVAQKPSTLPIQPIYSPRPLPQSGGQNIVPSQPHLPRDKRGFSSPTQVKPPSTSGTQAVSHVIRSPQPSFQALQRPGPNSGPPPPMISPSSSQPSSSQYTSPNGFSSRSGNDLLNSSISEIDHTDRGAYRVRKERHNTPSPSPSQQSSTLDQSLQTLSDDFPYQRVLPRQQRGPLHDIPQDGCSTFPNRRTHQFYPERIRMPSNPSFVSSNSKSSIEKVSDRGSPVSPFMYTPSQQSNSLPANMRQHKRPQIGETRSIYVEKSQEPSLGIQIESGSGGGIFVSSVSENSLAARAGIEIGDQLLEVCGINMRKATYHLAANVLRQCGDSITMLVQYNPEKYLDDESSDEGSSPESSATNTPQTGRNHQTGHHVGSDVSTITPSTSPQSMSPSHSSKPTDNSYMPCEPRFVFLKKNGAHEPLGVGLVGGNAVGIYVRDVAPNSIASGLQGLRCGDQILEFNGINLRSATAEQAALEISKPADSVTILAQYNIAKYNVIQDQPGDAIYVRALCDHDVDGDGELPFKKDDILFVDNTLYKGMCGVWQAWLVDDEGNKIRCGTIPSKSRLEEELVQKRSLSDMLHDDELKGSRRGSASARRSFFRRKKHQRNNSKDSRELNSFSDASINSDSINFLDDGALMPFQRVERLDCTVCRPVLILGPLSEPLVDKLTSESPDKYCRCQPEIVKATMSTLETGQDKGVFVDFKRRDSHYECIRVDTVKEIIEKSRHCMLSCNPAAIERLHKVQIYPIVVFIRHKSAKQIREVKDTRFLPEKLTNKAAKELFESFQETEQKYKTLFSEMIQGGNLAFMSVKIKGAIEKEQKKTLWIPAGSI